MRLSNRTAQSTRIILICAIICSALINFVVFVGFRTDENGENGVHAALGKHRKNLLEELLSVGGDSKRATVVPGKKVVSYVIYAPPKKVFEGDAEATQCVDNANFFARVVRSETDVRYVFHLMGDTKLPSDLEPKARSPNVRVRRHLGNANASASAHRVLLRVSGDEWYDDVDYFVFLDCATRGPFVDDAPVVASTPPPDPAKWLRGAPPGEPRWSYDALLPPPPPPRRFREQRWIDRFLSRLDDEDTGARRAHAVGATASCEPSPHVDVHAFAVDGKAAAVLEETWWETEDPGEFGREVAIAENMEVKVSASMLRNGLDIVVMDDRYRGSFLDQEKSNPCHGADTKTQKENPTLCLENKNPAGCFGVDPCQVMFVNYDGNTLRQNLIPQTTIDRIKDYHANNNRCKI